MLVYSQEPTPPPSKLKEPIPAEHMALVETFDGLLDRCRRVAQNPVSIPATSPKSITLLNCLSVRQ